MRTESLHATLMLVLVTLLWGVSFPLMKTWQDASAGCPGGVVLASFTLIAMRMLLAAGILIVLNPRLLTSPTRREHVMGVAIGTTFFLGYGLQVLGLAWVTPAVSGFITSLCSAWVPVLALCFFRIPISALALAGFGAGISGTVVLQWNESRDVLVFGWGQALTLIASVVFAVQVLMLDRWGKQVKSAHLTIGLLGVTGLAALVIATTTAAAGPGFTVWADWTHSMLRQRNVLSAFVVLAGLATVTFHLMNMFQPRVSANRAALIYLLEPVFAAVFSVILGHDQLTAQLLVGGAMVIGGNLLIEMPGWVRKS